MSVPPPDQAAAHFGPAGMRRFSLTGTPGLRLPDAARDLLTETGVPLLVTPYFRAAAETDAVALGTYAGHHGAERPQAGTDGWTRIGHDRLAQLCVRPDGAVQAVFLAGEADDMFVATDLASLIACLAALDRALPAIAAAPGLPAAAAAFRELDEELRTIDPSAFAERENWWPRVLDDVRHTLNFPFSSAFEYVDDAGNKQIVTDATGPGRPHPEEIIHRRLEAEGVPTDRVRRVYCELQPCMMPGHYCAVWLQQAYPQAEFTHSFDYGETADSREQGLKELITYTAQQAGRR
ncbi:SUKH-4 family immunity protein [Streptomyces sp. TRM S81-3]|uniref:SUKH-4 family immunity protein n=1 Tax=Streptomyces griseicoloratus TaxID=2752516 RepID=A0A926LE11_9ACTN|nr:SUKH-4 family immunity protein [Streptomyces griseicoloratus]MBD0425046.1 SUKH-4 family immunity protein [Streptomyces griseicoloratus]